MAKDGDIIETMFGWLVQLIGWIFNLLFKFVFSLIGGVFNLIGTGFKAIFGKNEKASKQS